MKYITRILTTVALIVFSNTVFAEVELGKDYHVLNPAQPTKRDAIEVLEFFSYQCSHCFYLHPHLAAWEKTKPRDVELIYVPVPNFHPTWEPAARAYYALESMGQIKRLDDLIYKAIDSKEANLYGIDSYADFVAKHGVDRAKFLAASDPNTFGGSLVKQKIANAGEMTVRYRIEGTPTLVVSGKYFIVARSDAAETIHILNDVIKVARKERSGR